MEFKRAGSGGAQQQGVWLASAPRRPDAAPAPARVQGRLRELQALCTPECEVLLFVAGQLSPPPPRRRTRRRTRGRTRALWPRGPRLPAASGPRRRVSPLRTRMAGVDGRYNEGARKALNFLLYGSSGYEISQSSKGDADLADVSPRPLLPLPQ